MSRSPKTRQPTIAIRRGRFPWETQLSGLIFESGDAPFSSDEVAALEETLKSSDLTETTGYDLRMYHTKTNVTFGPVYVQFYDAGELHGFWDQVEEWTTRNKGTVYSRTPHKCTSCNHYISNKYDPCPVCGHEELV